MFAFMSAEPRLHPNRDSLPYLALSGSSVSESDIYPSDDDQTQEHHPEPEQKEPSPSPPHRDDHTLLLPVVSHFLFLLPLTLLSGFYICLLLPSDILKVGYTAQRIHAQQISSAQLFIPSLYPSFIQILSNIYRYLFFHLAILLYDNSLKMYKNSVSVKPIDFFFFFLTRCQNLPD